MTFGALLQLFTSHVKQPSWRYENRQVWKITWNRVWVGWRQQSELWDVTTEIKHKTGHTVEGVNQIKCTTMKSLWMLMSVGSKKQKGLLKPNLKKTQNSTSGFGEPWRLCLEDTQQSISHVLLKLKTVSQETQNCVSRNSLSQENSKLSRKLKTLSQENSKLCLKKKSKHCFRKTLKLHLRYPRKP